MSTITMVGITFKDNPTEEQVKEIIPKWEKRVREYESKPYTFSKYLEKREFWSTNYSIAEFTIVSLITCLCILYLFFVSDMSDSVELAKRINSDSGIQNVQNYVFAGYLTINALLFLAIYHSYHIRATEWKEGIANQWQTLENLKRFDREISHYNRFNKGSIHQNKPYYDDYMKHAPSIRNEFPPFFFKIAFAALLGVMLATYLINVNFQEHKGSGSFDEFSKSSMYSYEIYSKNDYKLDVINVPKTVELKVHLDLEPGAKSTYEYYWQTRGIENNIYLDHKDSYLEIHLPSDTKNLTSY